MTRRVRLIGIGAGHPGLVTAEAAEAMRTVEVIVVARKAEDDPLVEARRAILAAHGAAQVPVVEVVDPPRERDREATATRAGYERAVDDWHESRAEVYEAALLDHPGDAGFLVWGDPAFYDSSIRVLGRVAERGRVAFELDVVPGISALQVLAARHRIVLHEVGQPVHVTTGRRLTEAVGQGQENIVVMLDGALACAGLEGAWTIWWGANLGTAHEALLAGPLDEVIGEIRARRAAVKAAAGWVMDSYLLRRA